MRKEARLTFSKIAVFMGLSREKAARETAAQETYNEGCNATIDNAHTFLLGVGTGDAAQATEREGAIAREVYDLASKPEAINARSAHPKVERHGIN